MNTNKKLLQINAITLLMLWGCFLHTTPTRAQDDAPAWQTDLQSGLSNMLDDDGDDRPNYELSGDFSVFEGSRNGTLNIVLDIKPHWHGYSQRELTGQVPTVIEVVSSDQFEMKGPFSPNIAPKKSRNELGATEEFEDQVIWSAPFELSASADPASLVIAVEVAGQVCKQQCVQFSGKEAQVKAKFSKFIRSAKVYKSDHGSLSGQIDKSMIKAGDGLTVSFTAKMDSGWHVYKREDFQRDGTTPQPTIIAFTNSAGWKVSPPVPSKEPVKHEIGLPDEPFCYYHDDEVTWTIEVTSVDDAKPGTYRLEGQILYQVCSDESCERPSSLDFSVPVMVGESSKNQSVPISLAENNADRDAVMKTSKDFWASNAESSGSYAPALALETLAFYMMLAFFAGLILNAMPCVLPVIGLKVMSFVQQAGEDRGKVLMLNLVFSAGLMSVFLLLATLSAFFGFGWGDWLTKSMTGSIIITSIVFAFGLSMLGVWELPIPGVSGGSSISKKSEEEGLAGAFFLGVLTTVLATPCTGPMLVPAITITAGQPPWVAYVIFSTIGLGMALPYLMIGIFPSLISWLPRPGAWMTTFKQITGFVLMATVVFLMSSFSSEPRSEYLVAMMTLLLFIAFGCWWIGRTSLAAERSDQAKAWGLGLATIFLGAYLGFSFMGPRPYELDWIEYSHAKLEELNAENRIVFIDFTGPG